jgi:hypothetical protein
MLINALKDPDAVLSYVAAEALVELKDPRLLNRYRRRSGQDRCEEHEPRRAKAGAGALEPLLPNEDG